MRRHAWEVASEGVIGQADAGRGLCLDVRVGRRIIGCLRGYAGDRSGQVSIQCVMHAHGSALLARVRVGLVLSAIAGLSGQASGQAVIDGAELTPALQHALTHRLDVVGIGDSNQLFGAHGFDHGQSLAWAESFGCWATGLTSAGENNGAGAGMGYQSSVYSTYPSDLVYQGAPKPLDQVMAGIDGVHPHRYVYLPRDRFVPSAKLVGMSVWSQHPMGITGPLRALFVYGTFEVAPDSTDPTSTFTPFARIDAPPYAVLARGAAVSTTSTPRSEIRSVTLDIPADAARVGPVGVRWTDPGTPRLDGPFLAFYQRVERRDKGDGVAFNTLYARGGQSARDMAEQLINTPNAQLKAYFAVLRDRQADAPDAGESPVRRILVRINTGLNDMNEPLASVGRNRVSVGNSPEAFADNLQAIIDRIREIWTISAWPEDELYFVIAPSHPIPVESGEPLLLSLRAAADAVAQANPRCACVRLDRLATSAEMVAQNWYHSSTDRYHLHVDGYVELSRREVAALRQAAGL